MEKDRLLVESHVEGNHVVHYALVKDNYPVEGILQEGSRKKGIQKGGIKQGDILHGGILMVGILMVSILKESGHVKCLRTSLCHFLQPLVVLCRLLPFFCVLRTEKLVEKNQIHETNPNEI